jgi:hypothetical protein
VISIFGVGKLLLKKKLFNRSWMKRVSKNSICSSSRFHHGSDGFGTLIFNLNNWLPRLHRAVPSTSLDKVVNRLRTESFAAGY